MDQPYFTQLDDKWHRIIDGDMTGCAQPVPMNNTWTHTEPDKDLCALCFPDKGKKK